MRLRLLYFGVLWGATVGATSLHRLGFGSIMNIEALPPRHWLWKAREAHARAKAMTSLEARRLMRDVARRYRQMATLASKQDPEDVVRDSLPAAKPPAR